MEKKKRTIKYLSVHYGLRYEISEEQAKEMLDEESFKTGYERCVTKGFAIRVCTDGIQICFERTEQDV